MNEFTVRGTFRTRDGDQPFETQLRAENESVAREHVYANFGAEHGLKRTQVDITEVQA